MKKKLLPVTLAYFLILIAVPCYIIYDYYSILSTGETYKIEVGAYDPYDPFRGRYVAIRPLLPELRWQTESVQLIKNDEDFVVAIKRVDDKLSDGVYPTGYVKKLILERYYLNEKTAPLVEERQRRAVAEGDLMYLVVKVKNGKYAIAGLYINDIAAEEYIQ